MSLAFLTKCGGKRFTVRRQRKYRKWPNKARAAANSRRQSARAVNQKPRNTPVRALQFGTADRTRPSKNRDMHKLAGGGRNGGTKQAANKGILYEAFRLKLSENLTRRNVSARVFRRRGQIAITRTGMFETVASDKPEASYLTQKLLHSDATIRVATEREEKVNRADKRDTSRENS